MKRAYYNDNDPYICEWARNLVRRRLVPDGDIDCRSILDINPADLHGFRQCHFFCGILGWPLALALAGWPDDRDVWTASCPCQPLSSAGARGGHADKRHLWPAFYRLVAECRPATIFGEQVASKDGREWLAGVRADLEHLGYAVGAADLPAASVGAPHIRQRCFWVAQSERRGSRSTCDQDIRPERRQLSIGRSSAAGGVADADIDQQHRQDLSDYWRDGIDPSGTAGRVADAVGGRAGARRGDDGKVRGLPGEERAQDGPDLFGRGSAIGGVADTDNDDRQHSAYSRTVGRAQPCGKSAESETGECRETIGDSRATGWVGNTDSRGCEEFEPKVRSVRAEPRSECTSQPNISSGLGDAAGRGCEEPPQPDLKPPQPERQASRWPDALGSNPWSTAVWLPCLDGKARRVEPSIQPLAHAGEWGIGSRVGILRGAGNAIIPPLAAEFIRAVMEVI